jgi:hypothetical protein
LNSTRLYLIYREYYISFSEISRQSTSRLLEEHQNLSAKI